MQQNRLLGDFGEPAAAAFPKRSRSPVETGERIFVCGVTLGKPSGVIPSSDAATVSHLPRLASSSAISGRAVKMSATRP